MRPFMLAVMVCVVAGLLMAGEPSYSAPQGLRQAELAVTGMT
jgi:hypothetical protein